MRAKVYAEHVKSCEKSLDSICRDLDAEANEIARIRHCQGGKDSDSSFGTYADCFKEQEVKYQAICRLCPELPTDGYRKHLEATYKEVAHFVYSKGIKRCVPSATVS